jgi:hypothetical protein
MFDFKNFEDLTMAFSGMQHNFFKRPYCVFSCNAAQVFGKDAPCYAVALFLQIKQNSILETPA